MTCMTTVLCTALTYRQAAPCQSFCEECRGLGRTTGAVHWQIISDGFEWSSERDPSLKNRHHIDIQTKHHELINGFFSTSLNEAALYFKIVSFNCLNQLQKTQQGPSPFSTIEGKWMSKIIAVAPRSDEVCVSVYVYMSVCYLLHTQCKLNLLYNSSHLCSRRHICMKQCISCCAS